MHILACWMVHKECAQLSPPQLSLEPLMESPKEMAHDLHHAKHEHNQNPLSRDSPQVPTTLNAPCTKSSQEDPLSNHECHSCPHVPRIPKMIDFML